VFKWSPADILLESVLALFPAAPAAGPRFEGLGPAVAGMLLPGKGKDTTWHLFRKPDLDATVFSTAVTRLALSGGSVPEICAITGRSHAEANAILEAHYLHGIRRLPGTRSASWRRSPGRFLKPPLKPHTLFYSGERKKCNDFKWLGHLDSNQD